MDITLDKAMIELVGVDTLKPFGVNTDSLRWKHSLVIDLTRLTRARANALRAALEPHRAVRGIKTRIDDITRWLSLLAGDSVRCKRIADFAPMLKHYLKSAPKHWIYATREHSDSHQPYYVSNITYTPPQKRDGLRIPAFVTMTYHWLELGTIWHNFIRFDSDDVVDLTAARALAVAGFQTETPELLAEYKSNHDYYVSIHNRVGLQFTAVGVGVPETDRKSYWYRRSADITLERDGVPSRVVVDVLSEDDEKTSSRDGRPSGSFWSAQPSDMAGSDDDDDTDIKPGDEDENQGDTTEDVDIPLAPSLMCFDLRRHVRLKIYVDQLTQYQYQTDLATKLILPDTTRDLVNMLVSHRGGFRDIVGGKGGGAIILCAGSPGTGKTLTSEVYSEAMERPLYSVQCSQLGTDPDELEKQLLMVFARAARWNAILLLDECDVYVAARGRDLQQNAIVGVFLRVLEYYAGVMFMTTNRADLVDDAIASRCLARIDYKTPTTANQIRIWRTLADNAEIKLSDREIESIVGRFPGLSGRDIKNLLKLSAMVSASSGHPITVKTVEFVKAFKPTTDIQKPEDVQ